MKPFGFVLQVGLALVTLQASGQVIINEIFYHAPDDIADLQWVELHNTTDQAVNLSGWKLSKGVKFEFGPGAIIAPHGYTVLCKDKTRFQEFYKAPVAGEFSRSFNHSGDRLELKNPAGKVVDSVEFGHHAPWPHGPDGRTASLERICPTAPGNLAGNWTGSPLSEDATQPGGTPGEKNAAFSASLPPLISDVTFPSNSIAPQQGIAVEANVQSKTELRQVVLLYRTLGPGVLEEEKEISMAKVGASARYAGSIPRQQAGQVVRFRIRAVDQNSAERIYPSPTEVRPALSCLVFTNVIPGKIPFGYILHADASEAQSALRLARTGGAADPTTPEGQARYMAQMEFRGALDLPVLWAALTLTNCEPVDLQKLRPVFQQQERECNLLEEKALAIGNPQEVRRKIPELIQPFKATMGASLKPVLTAEQTKAYESWRDAAPGNRGPGDAAAMLRQFVRLEPDYLHLAISTNVSEAQIGDLRTLYRDAIEQRDAMIPDVRRLMGNRDPQTQAEGEKLQAKAEGISSGVDKKLKQVLSPAQSRQFLAWKSSEQPPFMRHARTKPVEPVLGDSAFILVDPKTHEAKLFDFVRIPERSGGWKVHFGKDQPWNGMTVADIIFESKERWLLAEPLAYDLYHRAGVAACRTDFIRLNVDGQPAGYYLLIEQVNKAFFRHNGLRDDGNLYKANWTGNGLVGQHDKHINRRQGHEDLVHLVDQLEKTKSQPDEQWALIRREFDLEQVLTHYAVRMLISDWDGFFNNYWLYHDVNGTGKWTLYPWDEDKTWGEYDGWEQQGVLYNLPLTYGAEGDYPPGETGGRPSDSYGFRQWWRAGGYVSRPLLANPTFRKLLLARVKELIESEFTQAHLFPLVDAYQDRLLAEVRYRAQVKNEDPARDEKRFESNLASVKEFITKRRAWLLEQKEVQSAGPLDRALLK
jgi:CotH protein/lamin tail-like protein